jgi:PAS domain S-box-containing protein
LERLLAARTEELRASEAKYRTLVEHAPEAIVALDGDSGLFVEANETALRLFAVDHDTLLTLRPSDVSPPTQPDGTSSRDLALRKLQQALEPGGVPMFEWMHRDRRGRDFICEVRVARVPLEGRNLFIATVTDISARKAVEAELARFAAIAETTTDRVGIADLQGRTIYLNPAGRRMSGLPPEGDLSERTIDNAFTPESVRRLREVAIPHALRTGTWEGEVTLLHVDGSEIPMLLSGVVIRDAKGNPQYLAAVSRDMRPLKLAEQALRESEERYRALFENSTAAILVHDEKEFLQANPAAVRMFRANSEADLLGCHPRDRSPPFQPDGESTEAAAARHIAAAIAHGRHDFEWVARRLDGTDIPLAVSLTSLQVGGRTLIQAVMADLTGTKRAEQVLRERVRNASLTAEIAVALNAGTALEPMLQACADRLAHQLDAAFAGVWLAPAASEHLQLAALAGGPLPETCAADCDAFGDCIVSSIAREKRPRLDNELQHGACGADRAWVEREGIVALAGHPLLLDGRVLGVLALFAREPLGEEALSALGAIADAIALGIERKRAEAALAESEGRLRLIVDTALDAVITMDAGGRIRGWNAQAERTFGWSAAEAVGRPLSGLIIPAGLREQHERGLQRFLATGHGPVLNRRIEITALHREGHEFPVELAIAPLPEGTSWVFSAFARDITNRKHAEAELLKSLAREKELGELKSRFVSTVSHEFRTPLGVILSAAQILQRYLDRLSPADRAEHLDKICRHVQQLTKLIEEVLMLGQADSGRLACKPAPLDLRRFCEARVDEVLSATGRACPIQFEVAKFTGTARADDQLLTKIVSNLLSNAVKYSPAGHPVEFTLARDGRDAVFTIQDHGIGIPAEDLPKLFDAFHRARNVGQLPGSGLGLAIVRECVHRHGGRIAVESELGRGTTMTVRLPLFPAPRKRTVPNDSRTRP